LIVFNTSKRPIDAQVEIDAHALRFRSLHGSCASAPSAPGSYPVHVAALDYLICTTAPGA